MTADNFYWYASVLIFVPWALLLFAPKWHRTELVAFICALVLVVASACFTFAYIRSGVSEGGSLFSFNGFKNLFRSTEMLLTGWLNYLSFSLLIGTWQCRDARELKIPHIFVVPSLLLTMIAGPTGLLLYLLVRVTRTRKWAIK